MNSKWMNILQITRIQLGIVMMMIYFGNGVGFKGLVGMVCRTEQFGNGAVGDRCERRVRIGSVG